MKAIRNWIKFLVLGLVFAGIILSCATIGFSGDKALEGTWIGSDEKELIFNKGNYEILPLRGIYSTSDNNITITVTHMYSDFSIDEIDNEMIEIASGWYTKNQLTTEIENILNKLNLSETDMSTEDIVEALTEINDYFDNIFTTQTGTYSIIDNTLTIIIDDETEIFVKK